MSGTCLFTGKPLDENTKIEHTIPRSLCGRICSKTVTCSEFNEASSKCDAVLRQEFIMILSALAPLLPKESDPGKIFVTLDSNIPAIKKGGVIDLRSPYVIEKTSTGRPTRVFIPDNPKTLEKNLKRFGAEQSKIEYIALPGNKVYYNDIIVCSSQSEISIIKSILCTIDVILQKEKKEQFTRNEAMKPILNFIRTYVSKKLDKKGIAELDKYYLGMQLFDMKVFEKLLSFHRYKAKPFEHVIAFSSSTATKTLDAAWNVFSHEVHGVRLSTKWTGPRVCGFIANPIFQNEKISYQFLEEENPYFKLQKTDVKGFGCGKKPSPDSFLYPIKNREHAYYDALYYVEIHADDHLRESFQESATIADNNLSLYELLVARLKRSFTENYGMDLEQELEVIEKKYAFWKDKPSSILFEDKNELIMQFVHDYQEAYSSLVKGFHHPSKLLSSVTTVFNKVN